VYFLRDFSGLFIYIIWKPKKSLNYFSKINKFFYVVKKNPVFIIFLYMYVVKAQKTRFSQKTFSQISKLDIFICPFLKIAEKFFFKKRDFYKFILLLLISSNSATSVSNSLSVMVPLSFVIIMSIEFSSMLCSFSESV